MITSQILPSNAFVGSHLAADLGSTFPKFPVVRKGRGPQVPWMYESEVAHAVNRCPRSAFLLRTLAAVVGILSGAGGSPPTPAKAEPIGDSRMSLDASCRSESSRVFRRAGQDVTIRQEFAASSISSTGSHVWEGSTVLTTFMETMGADFFRGKTVLELGAGTGFASICAVLLGARSVVCTDGSSEVLELAKANAQANLKPAELARVKFSPLEWQEAVGSRFDSVTKGKGFDIILAADVTYDPQSIPILINLMRDVSAPSTTILLSHTVRSKISLLPFNDAFAVETNNAIPVSVTTCRDTFLPTFVLKMEPFRPT